jgi:hypothetical protein
MLAIKQFDPIFTCCLPETFSILQSAGLTVHPSVSQITLHGSRCLARNYRPGSDIDLSLLAFFATPPLINDDLEIKLEEVIEVTLHNWRGHIDLDLAVIFPLQPCSFACFQTTTHNPSLCSLGGIDCFGIYKIQKGFSGFVLDAGILVERMYPCITIWRKQEI